MIEFDKVFSQNSIPAIEETYASSMSLPIYKMYMYMTTCMYLNLYEAKALYMSVSEIGEVKL